MSANMSALMSAKPDTLILEVNMNELPNTKIVVPLTIEERLGLTQLANQECRGAQEQLRFILRRELLQYGLITADKNGKSAESYQ